jgi:hypothetical protein
VSVQTFWLEPTEDVAVGLRRYTNGDGFDCEHGHHHALVYTGREPATYEARDDRKVRTNALEFEIDRADPAWPTTCAQGCGYQFTEDDRWQRWTELLYRRTDTGELRVLHQAAPAPDAPSAEPGASWDAWWMPDFWRGPDGIALMVRCPDGHDWHVDSEARNCTRKGEPHQCWVRHGDPRQCRVTVDKAGDTCSAGGGSIDTGTWHGFLRDGVLA